MRTKLQISKHHLISQREKLDNESIIWDVLLCKRQFWKLFTLIQLINTSIIKTCVMYMKHYGVRPAYDDATCYNYIIIASVLGYLSDSVYVSFVYFFRIIYIIGFLNLNDVLVCDHAPYIMSK